MAPAWFLLKEPAWLIINIEVRNENRVIARNEMTKQSHVKVEIATLRSQRRIATLRSQRRIATLRSQRRITTLYS